MFKNSKLKLSLKICFLFCNLFFFFRNLFFFFRNSFFSAFFAIYLSFFVINLSFFEIYFSFLVMHFSCSLLISFFRNFLFFFLIFFFFFFLILFVLEYKVKFWSSDDAPVIRPLLNPRQVYLLRVRLVSSLNYLSQCQILSLTEDM